MNFRCYTCHKETEVCYTNAGTLGIIHGECQCRECYKAEHPECPICGKLTDKQWHFCCHCGHKIKEDK